MSITVAQSLSALTVNGQPVLRGSGDTEANRAVLIALEIAIPAPEFEILKLYLTTFYGYQQSWILDPRRLSLILKCRQIGASHALAFALVFWAAYFGETNCVISVGEREAVEVLAKAKLHLEALAKLGSKWAQIAQTNKTQISLRSGGRIISLPSSSGARGYSGNVLLDEAAYYESFDSIYDAAAGAITHGGRLRICSTPNGINRFFELVQNAPKIGWGLHQVTLHDAIADGMSIDEDNCWAQAYGDPRVFGQLFLCEFLDDNLQYLSSGLIAPAFEGYPEDPTAGVAYGGLDIGHQKDQTVLTIVHREGDLRWLVHQESHKLTDDTLLDRLVRKAIEEFSCHKIAVDATGLGSIPAARMKRQWGFRLEPLNLHGRMKEDLATRLYDGFASQEFKLPRKHLYGGKDVVAELKRDLMQIRRVVSDAGRVMYQAQRTADGHADRAWSLALALHAAGRQSRMVAAIKRRLQNQSLPKVANG